MLVHLYFQVRLVPHNFRKKVGDHAVRSAAVVRQIDGIQIRMLLNDLRSRQNVLRKWPVQIWIMTGQIHIMSFQMGKCQHSAPSL